MSGPHYSGAEARWSVQEMVTAMRAQGLARVIITNGHPQIQRTKLEACGAAELFDGVLVGGEEVLAGRADKPHPGIFLAACAIAGCKPHEVSPSQPSTWETFSHGQVSSCCIYWQQLPVTHCMLPCSRHGPAQQGMIGTACWRSTFHASWYCCRLCTSATACRQTLLAGTTPD